MSALASPQSEMVNPVGTIFCDNCSSSLTQHLSANKTANIGTWLANAELLQLFRRLITADQSYTTALNQCRFQQAVQQRSAAMLDRIAWAD